MLDVSYDSTDLFLLDSRALCNFPEIHFADGVYIARPPPLSAKERIEITPYS